MQFGPDEKLPGNEMANEINEIKQRVATFVSFDFSIVTKP